MMQTIKIIVIGAVPPLCRPRLSDRHLQLERWLVLAYPHDMRARRGDAR